MTNNRLLTLDYEPALERLGDDYYDLVPAAEFPQHILRFRNDQLLAKLGLEPKSVQDSHFVEAFGRFHHAPRPFLALRYHGYQFGEYNPFLGDGRGFLYGQVRGIDGDLYDFGTKGSGTTPYSRGGDGRLTLKGGVREVIAAESLHRSQVHTSRCLSLVETGEQLWRGDEPSPTRSSVMVRMSRSHIRFGTFERLHYHNRKDLIAILLDHVIEHYYSHLSSESDRYSRFYAELVARVARLAAQWMAAGFCHGVLNTDNMSITGESFDYGPYGFIETFNPRFTAAYFDYFGLYCYGNQPTICYENLLKLQRPLELVVSLADLEAGLGQFWPHYEQNYQALILQKLGLAADHSAETRPLFDQTLLLLQESQVPYHSFFAELAQQFAPDWRDDVGAILANAAVDQPLAELWHQWKITYFNQLLQQPASALEEIQTRLERYNPSTVPLRPLIEAAWAPIVETDDWSQLHNLVQQIRG
ncbi:MAG: protein adenylyltransferase SelO [Leptolyngbyaceae cyanobacterium]